MLISIENSIISARFQAFVRLFLLELLIPADNHFEASLSLALDRAVMDWEAA